MPPGRYGAAPRLPAAVSGGPCGGAGRQALLSCCVWVSCVLLALGCGQAIWVEGHTTTTPAVRDIGVRTGARTPSLLLPSASAAPPAPSRGATLRRPRPGRSDPPATAGGADPVAGRPPGWGGAAAVLVLAGLALAARVRGWAAHAVRRLPVGRAAPEAPRFLAHMAAHGPKKTLKEWREELKARPPETSQRFLRKMREFAIIAKWDADVRAARPRQMLVVVDTACKAKALEKFLGEPYKVMYTYGYLRDLPIFATARRSEGLEGRAKLFSRMGLYPEEGWRAEFYTLPGRHDILLKLQDEEEVADRIVLAFGRDREGEVHAWHIQELLGGDPSRYHRVHLDEITPKAVTEALASPSLPVDTNLVHAQLARRYLDRVVGFMLAPVLWDHVGRGLTLGRVPAVALRLVVEREWAIQQFEAQEGWALAVELSSAGGHLAMEVVAQDGAPFRPATEADCNAAVQELRWADFRVTDIAERKAVGKPAGPFTTVGLLAAAGAYFSLRGKKVTAAAQRLFDCGHITFPRTASTRVPPDALDAARRYISHTYGAEYLTAEPVTYDISEESEGEAGAIRPTDVAVEGAQLEAPGTQLNIDDVHRRLYELLRGQFLAGQMRPAEFLVHTVTVTATTPSGRTYELRAAGRRMTFDGFLRAQPLKAEADVLLPELPVGAQLRPSEFRPTVQYTTPPPRYSEGTLIKELVRLGIGRPETYGAVVETLRQGGFVFSDQQGLVAHRVAEIAYRRLRGAFDHLFDFDYVARLEAEVEKVALGQQDYKAVLDSFYCDFINRLDRVEASPIPANCDCITAVKCAQCGRPMRFRTGHTGTYLTCTGWDEQPRCRAIQPLLPVWRRGIAAGPPPPPDHRCPKCRSRMDAFLLSRAQRLHVCNRFPDCGGSELEDGRFLPALLDAQDVFGIPEEFVHTTMDVTCQRCGGAMVKRTGQFGRSYFCLDCAATRKALDDGSPAPLTIDPVHFPELKCERFNDTLVLKESRSGLFLCASQFPKYKEYRKPYLDELTLHAAELPLHLQYLTSGPLHDPAGYRTTVRFSKQHGNFLRSEVTPYTYRRQRYNNLTQWCAYYDRVTQRWVESSVDASGKPLPPNIIPEEPLWVGPSVRQRAKRVLKGLAKVEKRSRRAKLKRLRKVRQRLRSQGLPFVRQKLTEEVDEEYDIVQDVVA